MSQADKGAKVRGAADREKEHDGALQVDCGGPALLDSTGHPGSFRSALPPAWPWPPVVIKALKCEPPHSDVLKVDAENKNTGTQVTSKFG